LEEAKISEIGFEESFDHSWTSKDKDSSLLRFASSDKQKCADMFNLQVKNNQELVFGNET
jgi:hypothetical protein